MRHTTRTLSIWLFILFFSVVTTSMQWADNSPTPKKRRPASSQTGNAPHKRTGETLTPETEDLKAALQKQAQRIEDLTRTLGEMRSQIQVQQTELRNLKTDLDQSRAASEEARRQAHELVSLPEQVKTLQSNAASINQSFVELKKSADDTKKASESLAKNLNGFRFSGDLRFRFDNIFRSSNQDDPNAPVKAGSIQNSRMRYRLRLNVDKSIEKFVDFHMQLATGAINNPLTFDQDFTAITARHPFFISEAWVDVHNAKKTLSLQGGKLQEVFADSSRFLFDDDVRFNGFNERFVHSFADHSAKLTSIELRAGQYIFTNPNVAIVGTGAAGQVLLQAGAAPGSIGRASQMFHQGVILRGEITPNWKHEFVFDDQYYRNPNQIQLASTANGFPVLVSNGLGLALSGPLSGSGNATTAPGGAIFTAPDFNVIRLGSKLDWKGFQSHPRFPLTWNLQLARNTGAQFLRDAFLTSLSIGQAKERGDWRFLYIWSIKDANSILSQVTDDDLGTGTGVNLATHHFRIDYLLHKGVLLQNLIFIQNERRPSNPAQLFFVPLQRGTPTSVRYQGQLQFSF